jgi:hypothetical protein
MSTSVLPVASFRSADEAMDVVLSRRRVGVGLAHERVFGDQLVEADCAADPRTAGYLLAVTPAGRASRLA